MSAKRPRGPQPAKPQEQPRQPTPPSVQDRIRIRAYELYEARSGGPGDADGDWYQAEAEITGKIGETSE